MAEGRTGAEDVVPRIQPASPPPAGPRPRTGGEVEHSVSWQSLQKDQVNGPRDTLTRGELERILKLSPEGHGSNRQPKSDVEIFRNVLKRPRPQNI